MTRLAVVFLVLLRLAIGWHFLVEGFQKIPEKYLADVGLGGSGKSFSSTGYIREAPGPLGDAVRWAEGDPDDRALNRLVPLAIHEGEDPANAKPYERTPPGLAKDWEAYLKRFVSFYALNEGQRQRAEAVLQQSESKVVEWLSYVPPANAAAREKDPHYADWTTEQTRTFPSGEVKRRMSMAERVAEYRLKLADLRDTTSRKLRLFGKDVEGARLRAAKADVALLRLGLLSDLEKQTKAYHDALEKLLTEEQKEKGSLSPVKATSIVSYVDLVTPWALTAIGACLLFGLFSRLAAFLAAGFLVMTYLFFPAIPWLPAPPQVEGNYLFVNKNLVEMLALLVLACLPTGRWFGLDGILHAVAGLFRGRKAAA
jgi:uncharacterized membrane protein YphA (DoxX/SURF4 family)